MGIDYKKMSKQP